MLTDAVEQREVVSADGTVVPYFLVVKGKVPTDGKCKTILYGYGGFEVSLQPAYSGEVLYMCVLILVLFMCPHTSACRCSRRTRARFFRLVLYVCPHTGAIYVSSY
jgi:hypothetical protein